VRALVTGATGFAGTHLTAALSDAGHEVFAAGGPSDDHAFPLDVNDIGTVRAALDLARPDVVFHLAAQTFVPDALVEPMATYVPNIRGTALVAQAVRERVKAGAAIRLVFASSAEVYGLQRPDRFPLDETAPLNPANPYASSKAAAELLLLGEYRAFGLDVVVARAFNHIGPGQNDRFVAPAFAVQLARIAAGGPAQLLVGNLEARRDFLDVRDVARAYVALAERGAAGEVYNVCSGEARPVRDLLRELIILAHVPVEVREDPQRMRPSEVPLFVGSNAKLREATGWEPLIPFRESIKDIYAAAQSTIAS